MSEKQERANAYLLDVLEGCQISMAKRGTLDGHLPPQLWERFRIDLQNIYRKATGEPTATLHVEL
ncbi:hypothetical protein [Rhizobium leguminosarum]|uniref:hypothetical protein n=1 Tax=Rhizobium leguminosarum TaxID=384 RepID=UPI0015D97B00|nr:hypothetical protein [Rhizobium leguminosarum]NZD50567.1 hypothetical protein [Rhizobium leguminosarum]